MDMDSGTNCSCTHGEEMLAYLYNELSPEAREQFEAHMGSCFECIDEFAELAASRYSVFEWKSVEFVPMATPKFVIPSKRKPATASWFDGVKAALAWNGWAFAGGAAATILVAFVGIALWNVQPDTTIAVNDAVPTIDNAPAPSRPVESPADNRESESSTTVESKPADAFRPEPITPGRPASVRKQPTVAKAAARRKMPSVTVDTQRATASERLQNASTLGQYVEDQDDSLRLSDIFDDLDTRDME